MFDESKIGDRDFIITWEIESNIVLSIIATVATNHSDIGPVTAAGLDARRD